MRIVPPPAPVALGLMCKAPRPGLVKTRLAASIGEAAAAQLSRAFLEDGARAARRAGKRAMLDLLACFRPLDGAREIAEILGPDWPIAPADAGELGATMIEVLEAGLRRCPGGAMVMGADMPLLPAGLLVEAAESLRHAGPDGVVIIPTRDGGYGLLGLREEGAARALCAPMAWSTPGVLAETLARAKRAGLEVRLLPAMRDIDECDDLDWLLAEPDLERKAPSTAAALRKIAEAR